MKIKDRAYEPRVCLHIPSALTSVEILKVTALKTQRAKEDAATKRGTHGSNDEAHEG